MRALLVLPALQLYTALLPTSVAAAAPEIAALSSCIPENAHQAGEDLHHPAREPRVAPAFALSLNRLANQ